MNIVGICIAALAGALIGIWLSFLWLVVIVRHVCKNIDKYKDKLLELYNVAKGQK